MADNIQSSKDQPHSKKTMREIQAYIAGQKLKERSGAPHPAPPVGRFSPPLYAHLLEATSAHDQVGVEANPRPIRAPIIGPLLTRARELFHNLVIYYLDQFSARQIRFNAHMVGAMETLIHDLDVGSDRAPEAQVANLEARVASLEARLGRPPDVLHGQAR
jgi:hypothetical protein